MKIDLNDTYWDRLRGYVTEFKVDSRWLLRKYSDEKPYGSLRIVSFPNLPPGHLEAIFTFVTEIFPKSKAEILKTTEDYEMDELDLEVYSVDKKIDTETRVYKKPRKELDEMFGVKTFGDD